MLDLAAVSAEYRPEDDPDYPIRRSLSEMLNLPYVATAVQLEFHTTKTLGRDCPVLYGGSFGGGKMLRVDTPIPTPSGFRRIGDLVRGDLVFGRDGRDYAVLDAYTPELRAGWRLTFDDGSDLVAHDDHLWLTFSKREMVALRHRTPEFRAARRATRPSRIGGNMSARFSAVLAERNSAYPPETLPPPTGTVRTTSEIAETLRTKEGWANHAIPVAEPLELPHADLPVDPYLLGAWLGDGTTADGGLTTMDDEVVASFVDAGFPVKTMHHKTNDKAATYRFAGFRVALRELGVLGNKHVPEPYLWGSKAQRLALLQGLLDTDGTVTHAGSACFTTTKKPLADAVAHLARSLGHKARVREGTARLRGRVIGPKWEVQFQAHLPVFRLERKLERLKIATRATTRFRYVVAAERVEPTWMRCLRVASADHLFLAGEHLIPTHNSAAICADAIRECREVPDNHVLMARKHLVTFKMSTMDELLRLMPSDVVHRPSASMFLFPNGSWIRYSGLGDEREVQRHRSTEYGAIYVDEAHEISKPVFLTLAGRLRWKPAARAGRIKFRLTCNPEPGWIKEDFITDPVPGWEFIPALPDDNPYLPPDYKSSLRRLLPTEWYNAYLEGDWNAFITPNAILPAMLLEKAFRRSTIVSRTADCVWGVDVARFGKDLTVVAERRDLHFSFVNQWHNAAVDVTAGNILTHYRLARVKPSMICVDDEGVGGGVTDILTKYAKRGDLGGCKVVGVIANATAPDDARDRYVSMKAWLWFKMKTLIESGALVDLPAEPPELRLGLESHRYDVKNGRAFVEPKRLVKQRLGMSPDHADALILTMYEERKGTGYVAYDTPDQRLARYIASLPMEQRATALEDYERKEKARKRLANFQRLLGGQVPDLFLQDDDVGYSS